MNCDKFSLLYQNFLAAITTHHESLFFSKVLKDERRRQAMQTEIEALKKNEAWIIEKLPHGKKVLGCR